MDKIEIEYQNHKVPKDIQEKIIDDTYLALNIGDIAKEFFREEGRVRRLILRNKMLQYIAKVYYVIDEAKEEYSEILKQDEHYLKELQEHIEQNEEYLHQLLENLTDRNWQEMMRILDFCVFHYANNYNYIQGKRHGLDHALNGISFLDNRYTDTREEIKKWFQGKMEHEKAKHLEKKQ